MAAILLRFCRDHAEQLRLAYDSDVLCELLYDESEQIQQWLEQELEEDWLDQDELTVVSAMVRAVAERAAALPVVDEQAAVVAARAMVDALDRSHGRRFAGVFRGRQVTELGSGDPFPVCYPPLKQLFGQDLNTNPLRLGSPVHDMVWLRLMPELNRGHTVRLGFESEDVLADLAPTSQIGVAIPSDVGQLRFDRIAGRQPRFFGVRPMDAAAQQDTILRLLDEAAATGVRILVLPELCIDESGLEAIKNWFNQCEHRISLLVCGSVHVERNGERRNVSTTLLPGGKLIEHNKFNPFSLHLPDETGAMVAHREDIVTMPSVITINMFTDWSLTTLICKDFLEPEVDRILETLGVRLVLVPACSPKTSIFEHIAGLLAARNQALVVIGNLADPSALDPASVIVARPLHANAIERVHRSEIDSPSLHFINIAHSHDPDD